MHVALGLILVLIPSCRQENPNYCDGSPHNNCLNDGTTCREDVNCPSDRAVCNIVEGSGTCVQCTPEKKSACQEATPACIDNKCQKCTAHVQCDSKVCLMDVDGTCAAPADVAYVQSGGTGAMCTLDMPCGTLATAITTSKPYIKIAAGVVKDTGTTTIRGKTVTILADPGAVLDRDGDGTILQVQDANTNVSIYDLQIVGATDINSSAIKLDPATATTSLSLTRVTVAQNQGNGVSSKGGKLTISRSTFSANARGAILIDGTTFDITNNFIVQNGDENASVFGGVNFAGTISGSNRFEFNTIVDNRAVTSGTRSGGIICDNMVFTAPNNIIARNRLGLSTTLPNAQTVGACTYPTSKIQSDVIDLKFESPDMMPYSYKLLDGSSAVDQATTKSEVGIDHDGDPRPEPQGAQKDIGADEFRR